MVPLMFALSPEEFPVAAPLFSNIPYHTVIKTILNGSSPGHVYVNDAGNPTLAVAQFKHHTFLGGDPAIVHQIELLNFFSNEVVNNCKNLNIPLFRLLIPSPAWKAVIEELFGPLNPVYMDYQCYQKTIKKPNSEYLIPKEFFLQKITSKLVSKDFAGRDDLIEEMCSERVSVDTFLDNSFGIGAFYKNQLAGWCLSEYNHENCCEVGITTLPPHRDKGLAKAMTAHFCNLAIENGYDTILWHCDKSNLPSSRTALGSGFTLVEDSSVLAVYHDRAIHLAVHVNRAFQRRHFHDAIFWCQRALSENLSQSWIAWNAACAASQTGETDMAFAFLHTAIDLGFSDIEALDSSEHQSLLKNNPRWNTILGYLDKTKSY